MLHTYIGSSCWDRVIFSIAINTDISIVTRCIITNWMITMRVACPLYKSLDYWQNRTNRGQLDFLSFSSVLELSKERSNGAVMTLLLPICIDFYCFLHPGIHVVVIN